VSGNHDVAAVAALLEDETARQILLETRTQPMSAETLSDRCGVSPSTIYRRVEDLREQDLLEAQTRPDEDGHHYEVYAATLDRIVIDATDDGFEVDVTRSEGMAGRFARLVEEM
jgi:DNA-binding transcriptional ArsR family regulator